MFLLKYEIVSFFCSNRKPINFNCLSRFQFWLISNWFFAILVDYFPRYNCFILKNEIVFCIIMTGNQLMSILYLGSNFELYYMHNSIYSWIMFWNEIFSCNEKWNCHIYCCDIKPINLIRLSKFNIRPIQYSSFGM